MVDETDAAMPAAAAMADETNAMIAVPGPLEKENKNLSDDEVFVDLTTIIAPGKEKEFWRRASATIVM